MFAYKARVTAYVCVVIIVINAALFHAELSDSFRAALCGVLICAAVVPGVVRRSWRCASACATIVAGAYMYFVYWESEHEKYSLLRLPPAQRPISFVGTVCDTSLSTSGAQKHIIVEVGAFITPFNCQSRGKLLIDTTPDVEAERGDIIITRGVIEPPVKPCYPWDFSIQPTLRKSGAVAAFRNSTLIIVPLRDRHDLQAIIDDVRARIVKTHVEAIGEKQGNLLTSMVIGNRNVDVDDSIASAFRNLGISHILAASGFNLSIVVGSTWWLLRPAIRNRAVVNLCAGLMMAFFAALAGLSASIMRAALMCAGLLIANTFERRPDVLAALGGTLVLTLLLDPPCLTDVGLQLSYVTTLALMCQAGSIERLLAGKRHRNDLLRKFAGVAIPCAIAAASVFPLQLFYFWQTGVLQLPVNIMISPVVPIITLEGFVSSAFACVNLSWFSLILDNIAGIVVAALLFGVKALSSFDWCVISTGPPELWTVLLYYFFLALTLSTHRLSPRLYTGLGGVVICGIALLWRPAMPPLTVVQMFRATIAIDSSRNAVVLGDADLYQVRKCLAYFGTRVHSVKREPTGATSAMEWDLTRPNHLAVKILPSERKIHVRTNHSARLSRVIVYD